MSRNFDDVSLYDVQRLLERVSAHEEPITRTQLDAFIGHPRGPILPEQCLMARPVPEGLIANEGLATSAPGADDMILDPETKEPILLGSRGQMRVIARGGRFDEVAPTEYVDRGKILGISRSGEVVAAFWTHLKDPALDAGMEKYHLFVGSVEQGRGIRAAGVLFDGSVVKSVYSAGRHIEEYRDSDLLDPDSGLVWMEAHPLLDREPQRAVAIQTSRGVRFLSHENGEVSEWNDSSGEFTRDPNARTLPVSYAKHVAHYHELGEVVAYVGEPKREKREFVCWVLAKGSGRGEFVRQPSFKRVTDLFERDGAHCYWGLLDGFVYLMELPVSFEEG